MLQATDTADVAVYVADAGGIGYCFVNTAAPKSAAAFLRNRESTGWGLFATNDYKEGERIFSDTTAIAVPTGPGFQRICCRCYGTSSRVKNRDDCSSLFFCSNECLTASELVIRVCGNLVDQISAENGNESKSKTDGGYADIMRLVVLLLFRASMSTGCTSERNFRDIFRLESHSTHIISDDEFLHATETLHKSIESLAPSLLRPLETYRSSALPELDMRRILIQLMCIIRVNAQPIPFPGLPAGTALLALFPSLARANHSCEPNVAITFQVNRDHLLRDSSTTKPRSRREGATSTSSHFATFHAKLVSLRPIEPGDELCMSYLSNLCVPADVRRALLKEAFYFDCECTRCSREQTATSSDEIGDDGVKDLQKLYEFVNKEAAEQHAASGSKIAAACASTTAAGATVVDTMEGQLRNTNVTLTLNGILDAAERVIRSRRNPAAAASASTTPKKSSTSTGSTSPPSPSLTSSRAGAASETGSYSYNRGAPLPVNNNDYIYVVHDAASLILQRALQLKRSSSQSTTPSTTTSTTTTTTSTPPGSAGPSSMKARSVNTTTTSAAADPTMMVQLDVIVIRAVNLISRCWKEVNCGNCVILVDYLLNAVASGMKIVQQLVIASSNSGGGGGGGIGPRAAPTPTAAISDEIVRAIELAKVLAKEAELIAELHYSCSSLSVPVTVGQSQDAVEIYRRKMHQLCSALTKISSSSVWL